MFYKLKAAALGAVLVLGMLGAGTAQALSIDTSGGVHNPITGFGEPNAATIGQTFTVGADNVLDDFTFHVDDWLNPDFVDFEAYVMAWNGAMAAGPVLYQSAAMSTTNNGGSGGFEAFTLNTGGLSLTNGAQYVAFFTVSNLFDGAPGTSAVDAISSNNYAGGNLVFLNNGNNFGLLTTIGWSQIPSFDLSFQMNLSTAVPEPGTLLLMGLGLAGAALLRRRQNG